MKDTRQQFNIKPTEDFNMVLNGLRAYTGISSKTELIFLALLSLREKINDNFIYDGLNFKEVCEVQHNRLIRKYHSLFKTERISQDLFIERVKKDITKYLFYKRSNKDILDMINTYMEIAKTYKSKEPIKEIEKLLLDNIPPPSSNKIAWEKLKLEYSKSKEYAIKKIEIRK